jgi:hypothetical protein
VIDAVGTTTDQDLVVSPLVSLPFFARTANVWLPSKSPEYVLGLVHAPKVGESSRHSKVAPFGPENEKEAVVVALGLGGLEVMLGAAGGAANAIPATTVPVARTPSRITRRRANLFAALGRLTSPPSGRP